MARSFGQAASELRKYAAALPVRVNGYKKNIVSTIHNNLLQTTDVDTGEAMCNWIITPGAPSSEVRPAFDPSPRGYVSRKGGSRTWVHRVDPDITRQNNLAPAKEKAEDELAAIQPGEAVHIANNVEHIAFIDQGTPGLPGRHFADRAIVLAREVASRATLPSE